MFVAASAAATLTAGGIAYAYYTAGVTGTGTGSAVTDANTSAAVTWAASQVTGLAPGVTKTATVTVTNPNAYAVHYSSKSVTLSGIDTNGACDTATAVLTSPGATMPAATLTKSGTAGDHTTFTIDITMSDSPTVDQTPCAGKTLALNFAAA
jgi:hypothetical protein